MVEAKSVWLGVGFIRDSTDSKDTTITRIREDSIA